MKQAALSIVVLLHIGTIGFAQNKNSNPFDVKGNGRTLTPAIVTGATLHERSSSDKKFQNVISPLTGKAGVAPSIFFNKQAYNSIALGKNASVFDAQNAAVTYLEEFKTELGILNAAEEFVTTNIQSDALIQTHVRMQQVYKSIPVYGAEVILHTRNNHIEMLNGRFYPTPQISNTTPTINAATTTEIAINDLKVKGIYRTLNTQQKQLLNYTDPVAELIIYHKAMQTDAEKLTWKITARPNMMDYYVYFIDAHTGEIINKINMTCSIDGPKTATGNDLNNVSRTINTYQVGSTYYMIDATKSMFSSSRSSLPGNPVGVIQVYDAQNTYADNIAYVSSSSNTNWSSTAISAHYNAGVAYDYYKNTHNRNSINGEGGNIISIVNVSDQNGQGLDNAFWSGNAMFYGNGRVVLKPLAGSLDVAGHEMTHGVVQNTAGLVYEFQSGALNESLADIFGCMMDRDDWLIGEDIVKPQYYPSGAMRSLQDPHNGGTPGSNGWQPKHMNEYLELSEDDDHGGVHSNSGIPNHAFYLFATAVAKEKAEKVYYRAMTTYLTSTSQFIDMRIAVVQSATDLYGAASAEVTAAKNAFNMVGIYGNEPGNNDAVDLPVNPGQDYILSYDLNNSDPTMLYSSSTSGTNYVAKSTTVFNRKPSVMDNGSLCVFVSSDSRIRSISLIGSPNETILSNEAIWENVAISKDGNKLAALTKSIDTSIYVYNFTTSQWKRFKLYNPTFSGVEAGGVRYADVIEWDYTGEHIIYDAYNEIENTQGSNISYWDIGIINVWDNEINNWGSGKVEKLFTQLPEGASIGNPTFSKNAPYIIAFDYINSDGFSIMAKNIITGEVGTLAVNSRLGSPNYSKLDDKIIYDAVNANNEEVIAVRAVTANKLNGTGNAAQLIPDAQWGVWYSQGTRALLSDAKNITSFSFPALNPPVTASISGASITASVPASTDLTTLVPSFSSSPYSKVKLNGVTQTSGVNKNNFTNLLTYVVRAQDGTTKSYTVTVTKQTINSAKEITSFSFQGLNPAAVGVINGTNVSVNVPANTDVTSLVATFTVSLQAQALVNSVVQVSGTTANNFTNPVAYTVRAEDASTKNYTVTVTKGSVGIEDISKSAILNLFPNPAEDLLHVETKDHYTYVVYDISGKTILNGVNERGKPIQVSELDNGIYFIRIESVGVVGTGRFIKQ